jgi:hypothetical protein
METKLDRIRTIIGHVLMLAAGLAPFVYMVLR